MFKEIKAVFKVSEDTSFIKGECKDDRSHFIFEVKRMLSGAFAYGDRSCHSVIITNIPNALPYHFDTRYDKGYKKGLQEIEKRIKVESNNEIR